MSKIPSLQQDALHILQTIPGCHLILLPDAPRFTIAGATDAYLDATYLRRAEALGNGVFETLTDNVNYPDVTGVKNLLASLQCVVESKTGHRMADQRYDILNPQTGQFEYRVWSPFNKPVLNEAGDVQYIIHSVEDITEKIRLQQKSDVLEVQFNQSERRVRDMEQQQQWSELQVEKVEKQKEAQKRLYETLNNSTPDLVYVFDLEYRFIYANKALLDMWGSTWEASIDKGLRENGYEEWHAAMHEREIDQVVSTKSSIRGEVSFPHATLGKRVYDYIFVPVFNEKGEVEVVAGTTRDITDIKLSEQALIESNERFRNLADDSPMFVFIVENHPDAPITYWNKTWLIYTGQTEEEALGRAWDGILHPDDVEVAMDCYTPGFKAREGYLIPSVRVKRHDGVYRWHAFKGNPRYSATGQFNGFVGVGFDIHEQKMTEEALKQSEARARVAIATARLGTFEINAQAQTIIHSPRTAEILGLDADRQWPYQTIIDTVHPEDMSIRLKALEEAKKTGELFYEVRIIHPDKTIGWVRLNGKYVYQDNQPMIVGTIMDITGEKKTAELLEQKVELRTQELKAVNEQLKQFTYAASHDLQEPLRKISFFLDRLLINLGPSLDDGNKKIADRIQHTTGRMRSLIDDLLAYSNTSLGVTRFSAVDLTNTIHNVLDDMEATIIEKEAHVKVGNLPTVKGDQRQLRQLFQNLISNALKYHKKDAAPKVYITSSAVKGEAAGITIPDEQKGETFYLVEVIDEGIGFEAEDAARIFGLFQRLHGKAEYDGTGVGLAIVQKVAENHSGYIWAESRSGVGATFKLLLPATPWLPDSD